MEAIKSFLIWVTYFLVILFWLPLLALYRLFERDPRIYRTGRMFRNLGMVLVKINPNWKVKISGEKISSDQHPFIAVANHQSMGDIPVISHLPWEMKWVGKKELFDLPIVGWQMRLSGDISVNRKGVRRWEQVAKKAAYYLKHRCSIMIFPEGTRTKDGMVGKFTDGAFALAIRHQVPILPIVVDGTYDCLPKYHWIFKKIKEIKVVVLPFVSTIGLTESDLETLRNTVRESIINQLNLLRMPLANPT